MFVFEHKHRCLCLNTCVWRGLGLGLAQTQPNTVRVFPVFGLCLAVFGRAAPELALDWSAEEVGFPPPRSGPDEGVEEGRWLTSSAAGHLRAAGLRL